MQLLYFLIGKFIHQFPGDMKNYYFCLDDFDRLYCFSSC